MKRPVRPKEVVVRSLGEIVRQVSTLAAESNMKHWYRGQSDSSWNLLPSVFRGQGTDDEKKGAERNHMHTFRSRAGIRYEQAPSFEDIAGWISLMQHYGLPTRLLDWTRSPLVAAYFALEKYIYERHTQPIDACVWALQPHLLNASQGFDDITVSIDSGICKHEIQPAFYHSEAETGKVHAVMASETDLRMFVQQGSFTIHSTTTALDELRLPRGVLRKYVIPAQACERFALELAVSGFRKGDIYPDLQNLALDLYQFQPRLHALRR